MLAQSPPSAQFLRFRCELDSHHDRRERVIKASRDITSHSKKLIFTLQRVRNPPNTPLPPPLQKDYTTRLTTLHSLFTSTTPDLKTHRYHRQISPGIQEYIEAIAFHHYLTTGSLLTLSQARESLPSGGVEVTGTDYLLGMFDFSGEVMRYGITLIATTSTAAGTGGSGGGGGGGGRAGGGAGERVLMDLRALRCLFEELDFSPGGGVGKEVGKKMGVMRTCVEKVENAVYGVVVRGSERPGGGLAWMELTPPQLRRRDDGGGGGRRREEEEEEE